MGRKGAQALEKNPNWKGGRTVSDHGYVLVKRPDHPMADCRGYVYEHRLVAADKIGRPLDTTELVHHDQDHTKTNNAPDNLLVVLSQAEHSFLHRKYERGLRRPGEPNPDVSCECGCGTAFLRYDKEGRPRRFVSGHNTAERNRHGR